MKLNLLKLSKKKKEVLFLFPFLTFLVLSPMRGPLELKDRINFSMIFETKLRHQLKLYYSPKLGSLVQRRSDPQIFIPMSPQLSQFNSKYLVVTLTNVLRIVFFLFGLQFFGMNHLIVAMKALNGFDKSSMNVQ